MSYTPVVRTIVVERVAGETISAHRIVKRGLDGKLYYASCTNLDDIDRIVGLSLNAAEAGGVVRVLVLGTCKDPSFNFDVTKPLFLGVNGRLVQYVPDVALFVQRLGRVVGPQEILIDLDESIVLDLDEQFEIT